MSTPGPRLLIVNTVQAAAVLANDIAVSNKYGRARVEHLSTALTPEDREKTIKRIESRLADKTDTDWVLVATSCVEAGVDFSFRTGFREISSLLSLIQASGRINRSGSDENAEIWSFTLRDNSMLPTNKALAASSRILTDYLNDNRVTISPELCTKSVEDELRIDSRCIQTIEKLFKDEINMKFKTVDDEFTVIDSKTVTALVDGKLAEQVCYGNISWQEIQRKAVNIRESLVKNYKRQGIKIVEEIKPGLYKFSLSYDDFIGYMRGILNLISVNPDNYFV